MAVLVEAISIIIRAKNLLEQYPGGWKKFKEDENLVVWPINIKIYYVINPIVINSSSSKFQLWPF